MTITAKIEWTGVDNRLFDEASKNFQMTRDEYLNAAKGLRITYSRTLARDIAARVEADRLTKERMGRV